jgi:hypothetical protein
MDEEMKESRPHNSTYPKVAVQWLNQALRFTSTSSVHRYQSLPAVLLRGVLG